MEFLYVETLQIQVLELCYVLSMGTNKKCVRLLLISHWTLKINCHSRGETVAMYSRTTRACLWFSPRVIYIIFYVNGLYGTTFMLRLLRAYIFNEASPGEFGLAAGNASISVSFEELRLGVRLC
jgi:hypothetical protein